MQNEYVTSSIITTLNKRKIITKKIKAKNLLLEEYSKEEFNNLKPDDISYFWRKTILFIELNVAFVTKRYLVKLILIK